MADLDDNLLKEIEQGLVDGDNIPKILKDKGLEIRPSSVRKALREKHGDDYFKKLFSSSKRVIGRVDRIIGQIGSKQDFTEKELNDIIYKFQDCVIELSSRIDSL
jgi:hypothetical protein